MADDPMDVVAWRDLVDRCAQESIAVQAIVLQCEGATMREIGERLGVTESRIAQVLGNDKMRSAGLSRLRHLLLAGSLLFAFLGTVSASCATPRHDSNWENALNVPFRIYDPGGDRHPCDVKLRECFMEHLYPLIYRARAKSTTTQYFTALAHWERYIEQRASTTSTRAQDVSPITTPKDLVSHISDPILNDFGLWLMAEIPAGAGLSIDTAAKQWKKIRGRRKDDLQPGLAIQASSPQVRSRRQDA